MKSEERHQLMQSDLGVATEKSVSFFEQHLGTLIGVVCAAFLLIVVIVWRSSSSGPGNAAAWTMLDSATNLEEFGSVVDKYKGTPPAQWAQLQIAEKSLQNAMPMMFSNREVALTDLKQSREAFDSLLQDKKISPVIRERALWGFALCLETGCDGDTAKPVQAYERLLTEFPDSIFKSVADERISALKKPGAGEFYSWFGKENPKPPEVRPSDIKPGGINLPAPSGPDDQMDGFMPELPGKKPAVEGETSATPSTSEEKKPDEAKPAEKPDAEKSEKDNAAGDKPAAPAEPGAGDKPSATEPPKSEEKPGEKK